MDSVKIDSVEIDSEKVLDQLEEKDILKYVEDTYGVNKIIKYISIKDFVAFHGCEDILDELSERNVIEHFGFELKDE